jgi:hypothetical protein
MKTLMRHLWLGALALSIIFIALGAMFMVTGLNAKTMISDELVAQDIYLGNDAVMFGETPGDRVENGSTAEIEAKIIALHTDGKYGVYSSLERDDPHRADILNGLALRNSLNMAVMGYRIANLAMGTGAIIALLGTGTVAFLAPVLYLSMTKEEEEKEGAVNTRAPAPHPA